MEQREVRDKEGLSWTCVQAYAGLEGKKGEKAAEIAETDDEQVPVVCTPSGGAQSVRLELPVDWLQQLSDEELLKQIKAAQDQFLAQVLHPKAKETRQTGYWLFVVAETTAMFG